MTKPKLYYGVIWRDEEISDHCFFFKNLNAAKECLNKFGKANPDLYRQKKIVKIIVEDV